VELDLAPTRPECGRAIRHRPDRVVLARALCWLYISGPTIGLLALTLPHSAKTNDVGIVALILVAYAVAGLVLVVFDRLLLWSFQLVIAFGTCLISLAVFFGGDDSHAYSFFYLWVGLYSAYFFELRFAALQGVVIAFAYAVVLAVLEPPGVPIDRWVITIGTLVVTGGLVALLKTRVEGLIATLSDAARTDPLTGLPNRRGFEQALELELERARRGGQPFAVLAADLDHFKAVNDRLGHPGGDRALTRSATTLSEGKRMIDAVARVGGEEFSVIAPATDERGAYALAERLRTRLRAAFLSEPVPLTISVGIALYPDHGGSAESLLRADDEALYAAKKLGRDRCVVFSYELADTLSLIEGKEAAGQVGMLLTLAELLDMRNPDTVRHSKRVAHYAELAARELGLAPEHIARIRMAGLLHDIGKIGIPDSILDKPGPLTDEEWVEMRRHPEIGAGLVSGTELEDIRPWILSHHEQPGGGGYPSGLGHDEIPVEAAILAVADAFEAMTADRSYRPAIGHEAAQAELERCPGRSSTSASSPRSCAPCAVSCVSVGALGTWDTRAPMPRPSRTLPSAIHPSRAEHRALTAPLDRTRSEPSLPPQASWAGRRGQLSPGSQRRQEATGGRYCVRTA